MRGNTWVSASTTVRFQPSLAIALSTMKPMKPAPTRTARGVPCALDMTCLASSSVQKVYTPSWSTPSIGGRWADEPVAINKVSNG